jgi:hypothetical protein
MDKAQKNVVTLFLNTLKMQGFYDCQSLHFGEKRIDLNETEYLRLYLSTREENMHNSAVIGYNPTAAASNKTSTC